MCRLGRQTDLFPMWVSGLVCSAIGALGGVEERSPKPCGVSSRLAHCIGIAGSGSRYGLGKGPCQPTVESTVLAVDEIPKSVALTVKSSITAASKMASSSPDRARCH